MCFIFLRKVDIIVNKLFIICGDDMKLIRIIALILIFSLIFAFSSCKTENITETTTAVYEETVENIITEEASAVPVETTADIPVETLTEALVTVPETTEAPTEAVTEPVTEATTAVLEDVSSWDTQKIADFYKIAAENTGNSVKSEQVVELSDISVNNGVLGGMFSFVTPVLSKFLSSKAAVTDGITGDFNKLTAADVSSSRAQKADSGTVLEFSLHNQSGNAKEGTDGSVSHAVSVVGDLGSIMLQLKDAGLPIEISVEKTVISYSDASVKVLIGEDGKIVNGMWTCTVEINLSDYSFAGARVDSTRVVLKNTITVNGGFNS